jgi:hypothetical protein
MTIFAISRRVLRIGYLFVLVMMISASSLLTGCSGSSSNQSLSMAPMSQMPVEVQNAPTMVKEAYQFAVANPEAVKNVPCYCGCVGSGHTSNYSCYVQETKPSGEVVFDYHALGCSLCVNITKDVMNMTKAGKAPQEIRAAIDKTYAQYGPPTIAPVE